MYGGGGQKLRDTEFTMTPDRQLAGGLLFTLIIKAHAAIAYTKTSQPYHERMQVSSYTTYKFMYKHYV